jgi:hypothetical protein
MKATGLVSWAAWNPDMHAYMIQDGKVNLLFYRHLMAEMPSPQSPVNATGDAGPVFPDEAQRPAVQRGGSPGALIDNGGALADLQKNVTDFARALTRADS